MHVVLATPEQRAVFMQAMRCRGAGVCDSADIEALHVLVQ